MSRKSVRVICLLQYGSCKLYYAYAHFVLMVFGTLVIVMNDCFALKHFSVTRLS